jgi:hypothetical protein
MRTRCGLTLFVLLLAACTEAREGCPPGERVVGNSCAPVRITPPPPDAAPSDGPAPDAMPACPAGQTMCGSDCVDLQTDPSHCGACDTPCQSVRGCTMGTCASPASSFDYVINMITVESAGAGMAPNPMTFNQGVSGFNLDGRFSGPAGSAPADCAHGDFFSTLDPDQNMGTCTAGMARGGAGCTGGVDNQLPELVNILSGFGTDIRMTISDQLNTGRLVMLVRISDVNGTPGPGFNDNSVNVTIFTQGRPMFASCAMRNMPGQNYAIDAMTQELTFTGRIANGRLIINPPAAEGMPNFTFALPVTGINIPLRLSQTRFRIDLAPDSGSRGNLGGFIPLSDLTTMLMPLLPAGIPPATIRTVLSSLVDVQYPTGNAMGCTDPNGAIGIGFGFTLLRANVQSARVTGPQVGRCGSM